MTKPIHYTCPHELVPVVEAALAAHGYGIEIPLQRSIGGTSAMLMTCGAASILFTLRRDSDLADIEVSGIARDVAANLIDSLPINLSRRN